MANTETSTSQNLIKNENNSENNTNLLIKPTDHFTSLRDFMFCEHLKDVSIKAGGRIFRVHKLILANSIGYFDELFRSAQDNESEVEVDIDDPEIMNTFITYAYTGEMKVNENNAFSILKAAAILKTNRVHDSCRVFLIELMRNDFENTTLKKEYLDLDYEFWKTAILSLQAEVSTKLIFNAATRWINHNYDQRNTQVLNLLNLVPLSDLSSDDIDGFLFQDEYSIGFKHKEIVFEVHSRRFQLVKQLSLTNRNSAEANAQSESSTNNLNVENSANRGEHLEHDVGYQSSGESSRDRVPRNTMTRIPEEIVNNLQGNTTTTSDIVKTELLINDDVITENSLDQNSSENEADEYSNIAPIADDAPGSPTLGISLNNNSRKIYVLSLEQSRVIEIYEPETNTWSSIQMAENENMLNWFSCTGYKGKLYKFGGFKVMRRSELHLWSVAVFKPGRNAWNELQPMIIKRRESGAVSLNTYLYVCGGWTGDEITNSVERYSVSRRAWELISPMRERRCAPAVVVFEDCIYAIGGVGRRTRSDDVYLDTVEVYNLRTQEWTILPARMKTKRSSCAAAVLNGKIYVCGGWHHPNALNVVEMFDPRLRTWSTVESMNKGRKQFLVVAYLGKLWAIGGARGEAWVEVYDPRENRWSCRERRGVNTNIHVTGSLL
ncbi:kelch-like protein diablo [Nasonia vitripennis]|uniref:Kelch-like protein diablo n=1 Tax=Nasonia vitripennis TaxID=7425 RepID=A0A7M7M856_NASVI|nr:kelch-like protein diablo [Nasonia vitripennis]